jgi:transposase-like protein
MRKRSKEEKREIVEESPESGVTAVSVAGKYGVRPSQIFERRRAYKEGRLTVEVNAPALLPVRLSDVSRTARPAPTAGAISIELSNPSIEIHGAADPVSLGIVLECLRQ